MIERLEKKLVATQQLIAPNIMQFSPYHSQIQTQSAIKKLSGI
jgi:hypothetical protein